MIDDTTIGGSSSKFPPTRRSAIVASGSSQPEERQQALEKIAAAYWKPVYKFIRLKWSQSNEDAKDLTQAFFTRALEKQFFTDYRPEKASFRTFIRTCVTRFVINESKYANRLKRGGDAQNVPLETAEDVCGENLQEVFEKEWIRTLFTLAVEDLRSLCLTKGKRLHFELFERYDLEHCELAYAQLAAKFEIAPTDVTNYLAWCRREFRRLLLDRIRELTVDAAEFRREARLVLGETDDYLR